MWLLGYLLILFAVVVIFGFATRNDEAKVRLEIATFGCNISVYNLRLGYKRFWVYVIFEPDNKLQFFGNTIGEVQFKISKCCKQMAQERDGVNFKKYNKNYKFFEVGVEMDGQTLSNTQFANLTTSSMRSTNRPIVGYRHSDGFEPMWGPSDDPIRAEL